MPVFRCCLLLAHMALLVVLEASACVAQQTLADPRLLLAGPGVDRPRFKSKPARELMSEPEYTAYTQALERLDYEAAGKLLNAAFIRAYPQFESARLKPNCLLDRGCRYWMIYANSTFYEYGFCRAILELNAAAREARQEKIVPPKFALKPFPEKTKYRNHSVFRRDEALGALIGQAELNYAPALIKLASLVRGGGVFKAGDEAEYYMLRRACLVGHDCTALAPRMAQLRTAIAPERIDLIESKARAERLDRPRLQNILLGEGF